MTYNTISSHQLLKSGLSVSPFLVCWDAWLCRSPPPWSVQRPFPAEHGSLWSLLLLISPLLHPVLGVSKTAFGMVDTEVDSPTMVKTVHLTSLAVSLLATWVLSVALLYSGHCSLFTAHIFFGTGVQAAVPNVSYSQQLVPVYLSHFKWVFLMLQRCCTVPPFSPATGVLSIMPPISLQPYVYYVLYCCIALLSLPLLLRSILLQVLLLFPLFGALCTHLNWFCPPCCCIASATASLYPSVPEQLPPAQKCQQHEMHLPRNRRMINMYRRV